MVHFSSYPSSALLYPNPFHLPHSFIFLPIVLYLCLNCPHLLSTLRSFIYSQSFIFLPIVLYLLPKLSIIHCFPPHLSSTLSPFIYTPSSTMLYPAPVFASPSSPAIRSPRRFGPYSLPFIHGDSSPGSVLLVAPSLLN